MLDLIWFFVLTIAAFVFSFKSNSIADNVDKGNSFVVLTLSGMMCSILSLVVSNNFTVLPVLHFLRKWQVQTGLAEATCLLFFIFYVFLISFLPLLIESLKLNNIQNPNGELKQKRL